MQLNECIWNGLFRYITKQSVLESTDYTHDTEWSMATSILVKCNIKIAVLKYWIYLLTYLFTYLQSAAIPWYYWVYCYFSWYLCFNGHFSRWTWVSWCLVKQRMMEVVVTIGATRLAKLQANCHHQQTNIQFLWAGCPSCCPTNSVKALKGKIYSMDMLTPNSPGSLPTLSLTTNSSWLPCLSALWCQYFIYFCQIVHTARHSLTFLSVPDLSFIATLLIFC